MADRFRTFATTIYPESAPENFREIIEDLHIVGFLSPLHDSDRKKDGTYKKEHYHFITWFDGVQNVETVREMFKSFGGVGVEVVKHKKAYIRYLCHLDNHDKVEYNEEEVESFGPCNYKLESGGVKEFDKYEILDQIFEFIEEKDLFSFCKLLTYARKNNRQWFQVIVENYSHVIIEYQKSLEWTRKKEKNFEEICASLENDKL